MMRPCRGTNATTTPPTAGTKVVSVNIIESFSTVRPCQPLELHGEAEVGNQEQSRGANRKPSRVRADVSRLHALDQSPHAAHTACRQASAAVNQSTISYAPQQVAGNEEYRSHDERGVNLVDPVLMDE